MDNQRIAQILQAHGVPHYTNGGRIYADSMEAYTALYSITVDMTGWTAAKLYNWLGY